MKQEVRGVMVTEPEGRRAVATMSPLEGGGMRLRLETELGSEILEMDVVEAEAQTIKCPAGKYGLEFASEVGTLWWTDAKGRTAGLIPDSAIRVLAEVPDAIQLPRLPRKDDE